jgi:hypothetical protein
MTILFLAFLFVVTRRRELWLRYIAAEAAFWTRLGIPARIAESSRRFEGSGTFIGVLWFLVAWFLLLALANGGAYVYFKGNLLYERQPNVALDSDARHAPRTALRNSLTVMAVCS